MLSSRPDLSWDASSGRIRAAFLKEAAQARPDREPHQGATPTRDAEGPAVPAPPSGAAGLATASADPPAEVRRIARQLADHPALRAGGSVETRLAPEELGLVRLSVETSETGLRVVIEAARPETADLMRRHVETLRQELRQEGLGSVSVSIGGEGRNGGASGQDRGSGGGWPLPAASNTGGGSAQVLAGTPDAVVLIRTASPAGHIDLRF